MSPAASDPVRAAATPGPRPAGNRILLIDDDKRLADMVGRYLAQAGFLLTHGPDARSGFERLCGADPPPDLILLDLMLPDADGLDVCRDIRRLPAPAGQTPILMLTARGETTDRVVGLELGADDYLPKPFEPRELLARIRALLRRSVPPAEAVGPAQSASGRVAAGAAPADAAVRLVFGRLEIEPDARRLLVDSVERPLTAYQFDLLVALARNAGRVMTRERLMDLVKGEPLEAFDRSIDVHVGKIRQAIESDPKHPRRLLTVRGTGYVFARQQDT